MIHETQTNDCFQPYEVAVGFERDRARALASLTRQTDGCRAGAALYPSAGTAWHGGAAAMAEFEDVWHATAIAVAFDRIEAARSYAADRGWRLITVRRGRVA